MLSAPRGAGDIRDPDAWWTERRTLARLLLDAGKPGVAAQIAGDATKPRKEIYQIGQAFLTGWIALRFLHDPRSAARDFARIQAITARPRALARASYWLGRAAEASHDGELARKHYEAAAQHATAYYGQLARVRLGHRQTQLRRPPALNDAERVMFGDNELVRAAALLYATGNRELVAPFVADLDRVRDRHVLALIGEISARHRDPGAMLQLGRSALGHGFAFDQYAFPSVGLPKYTPIGPKVDKSLVYAIARAESAFNPRAVSGARAMGLMQVTPAAARTLARRMGFKFHPKRLRNDPAYNLKIGSAEIGSLVHDYDGNHVLAFVGYNAGRGRVKQWIARYGDPRRRDVDVVDWVERIPFAETRNYVQRVLENLQVYRSRFGRPRLQIDADMRGSPG